jgi:uncharacterized damage-inducible protein DinB
MTVNEQERTELLETLAVHRYFLTSAAQGLTDEQARATPTVSALSVGGLIKHVSAIEAQWASFITDGPAAFGSSGETGWSPDAFTMTSNLEDTLAEYAATAARTEEVVRGLDSLDASHPLPEAPWFEKGASRSARRVLTHLVGETAQHAGHADIIRETIDGKKSMG